ncbi:gluconokinase [Aureimonas flava]|uniref:Gluconokinase n=1 Tax=Aureimonas flava TaxID=2320271 RepID=A0A3A1WK75_9HYPH|nr:gluconokinase, GntK/IdnK-type [Aureimonas flava]RIY00712.1 gluconokinase [Aureimonas flava]
MTGAGPEAAARQTAAAAPPPVVVVMGVSGAGKTTLGRMLAARHAFRFLDGDDFHPADNVAKMRAGIPLDDSDRAPWLQCLSDILSQAGEPTVLACSALKACYREALAARCPQAFFVHLAGSRQVIGGRLAARSGHYMPPSLLASQMEALEAPRDTDTSVTLDCGRPLEELCDAVLLALAARRAGAA